jgi:glycosyltransferase involved in cell wall biosynthesis
MAQSLPEREVIVVDDASSDGTAGWLASREREGDGLRVVTLKEHAERSAARNRGLERARGRCVLFLDDDDLLRPSALERLHSALTAHSDAIAAAGGNAAFRNEGGMVTSWCPRRTYKRVIWAELLVQWNMPQQAILWRTDAITSVGGWDEAILEGEDWELLVRASRSRPMVFIPEIVLDIRRHSGQASPWTRSETLRAEREWLQRHLASVPVEQQALGRRLVEARWLWRSGRSAYRDLQITKAVSAYWRAVRIAPILVTSPLLRPMTRRDMGRACLGLVIGRRGIVAARQAKGLRQALREARRRGPDAKV